ncbi:hypothetical protein [Nonomuraea guangzhouensis]|uniref:Uncharacterized protein n=1 Tax=Nonomuraea guangzhouensis TaxID=1291555 RepID=A0ABW4GPU3_9ACTN|nr:hypothetical protein [Nonomuraea guangzhouensis]
MDGTDFVEGLTAAGLLDPPAGVLPLAVSLGRWALTQLGGSAIGSSGFWEALAVAVYILVQLGLPPLLALRERRLRRAGELL